MNIEGKMLKDLEELKLKYLSLGKRAMKDNDKEEVKKCLDEIDNIQKRIDDFKLVINNK